MARYKPERVISIASTLVLLFGAVPAAAQDCSDLGNYFTTCDNQIMGLGHVVGPTDVNSCCATCCSVPNCTACQWKDSSVRGGGCWTGAVKNLPTQCDTDPGRGGWQGMVRTKFSCNQGACTPDFNGNSDDKPSCQSSCTPPPPPPTPP
eukprot:CAMPEP_0182938958 /NCGR_PEP_ID=MMETSP0105_2-20130417/44817_1 /TAXON_ID=81532 ORGANISM="Acanthoeca-like sp., Strain 10tr" /NCGR_SAMPLE_ID=MMETSP0105_2 /ASSEMBLY_ACC=CAM_ASM_000205 /LENGTH=148 /DNA_ID=CAMNT_0025078313 /DNA_START=66 /DNA_END=509 /DNA_ORIENTATION=-